MARKVFDTQLIEVLIPKGSTTAKFQLPDEPNLRDVHLYGIETYTSEILPVSVLSQTPLAPQKLVQVTYLTLQNYRGKNFQWQSPLINFLNIFAPALGQLIEWFPRVFTGQRFNCPKSYIEIADLSQVSATQDQVILLEFHYKEISSTQKKDKDSDFENRS